MTDVMDSANPEGGPFFIWDRASSKFVRTDQASEEQMRLYGSALYTSFGSGRSRVMTPIDPQGRATSYAVEQSTRRGELVPAPRSAGRAGLQEQRREERRQIEADIQERRRKIEALDIDVNQSSLWQEMSLQTKQLLYSDPTLLEGVDLGPLDMSTVMDYVFFGTPRSPGLFMEGVSNEYVWVPELRRFKNAMFASEEERMNSRVYTREDVQRSGEILEFEPLGETLEREFPFLPPVGRAIAAGARGVAGAVEAAFPGWFGSPEEFEDIEGFPDNAFVTRRETGPFGNVVTTQVPNAAVLGPWIVSNYELLSANQQRKIDNLVENARASYDEEVFASLSPEEQRMIRNSNTGYNPWDSIDSRTKPIRAVRDTTPEQREAATRAVATQELEGRRFAGRYGAEQVSAEEQRAMVQRRQMMNTLAGDVEKTIARRYEQYAFNAVPLGFSAEEFVRVDPSMPGGDTQRQLQELTAKEVAGTITQSERGQLDALNAELASATPYLQFRPGMVAYTARERQQIAQQDSFRRGRLLTDSERAETEGRGRALQASAYRSMATEGRKPLTEGQAMLMLREISRNPVRMARLKQQMVAAGADDSKYVNDTAMDAETIDSWTNPKYGVVAMANNAGMDPMAYLAQLQLDPTNRQTAPRNTGSGAGFTVRLPSPDDVATVVQDVAYRRIGQRIDSEQAAQIAQAYVQMAESQYRSQQGASTITEPMSADTFAEQQISQQMGSEEMVFQTGLQLDTLIDMIGGAR